MAIWLFCFNELASVYLSSNGLCGGDNMALGLVEKLDGHSNDDKVDLNSNFGS